MRRGTALALALVLATSGLAGTLASGAVAQTRDPAAAEAFFAEGRALLKQGRYPEACAKFEASQKLDPGNGTLMNLADCYEKSGRLASSWLSFREAASAASSAGQAARASHARARAAAIEPRLCRLRVAVDASTSAPVVRDGLVVDRSVWGEAVPVDPGHHSVVVRSGDAVMFQRDVLIEPSANGSCEPQTVVVPALSLPRAPPASHSAAEPPSSSAAPASPIAAESPASTSIRQKPILPLVLAGVGVVAMGAGTYFGFHANDEWSDARSKCVAAGCGSEAQSLAASARTDAAIGTVAFVGGAALTIGGVAWWLLAPPSAPSTNVAFGPSLERDSLGVVGFGRF